MRHDTYNPDDGIAFFVRKPEQGKVKTRLQETLGPEKAAGLYRCFALDMLQTLSACGRSVNVFFHPPGAQAFMKNWLKGVSAYIPQTGEDLGMKMANAFSHLFACGFQRAVLVGSDIPDLPGKIIEDAFERLDAGQAVIGPAEDGGYYLIGFPGKTFTEEVFTDMPWGADDVFERTARRFTQIGRPFARLASWPDIDTFQDLMALSSRHQTDAAAPRTFCYMRKIGMR